MKEADELPYSMIICVHQSRIHNHNQTFFKLEVYIYFRQVKRKKHQPFKINNYCLIIPYSLASYFQIKKKLKSIIYFNMN